MRVLLNLILLLALLLPTGAYAIKSECMIQQRRLNTTIEASHACKQDSDCVILSPGCELGCALAVNANSAATLRGDTAMYAQNCSRCTTECPQEDLAAKAKCQSGICTAIIPPKIATPKTIKEMEEWFNKQRSTQQGLPSPPINSAPPKPLNFN
jgi:hypothetical protein